MRSRPPGSYAKNLDERAQCLREGEHLPRKGEGGGGAKSTFPDGLERTNLSAPPSVYSESQFRSSIKRMNSPCLPSAVVCHCFFIPRFTLDSGLLSHVCSGSCQGLFSLSVFC